MADTKLSQILGGSEPWFRLRRVQLYVHHSLADGHSWSQSVYIPFKPRQCIVRQVVFNRDPAVPTAMFILRGISLDNSVLAIFPANNVPVEPGVTVDLVDKHVGPTLQFQLQDLDETVPVGAAGQGIVSFILEFVE